MSLPEEVKQKLRKNRIWVRDSRWLSLLIRLSKMWLRTLWLVPLCLLKFNGYHPQIRKSFLSDMIDYHCEYLSFLNNCYFQIMEVNCDCSYFFRRSILNIWPNLTMLMWDSEITFENLIIFSKKFLIHMKELVDYRNKSPTSLKLTLDLKEKSWRSEKWTENC